MLSLLRKKSAKQDYSFEIRDFCHALKYEYLGQALLDFDDINERNFTLALIVVYRQRCGIGSAIMKRITEFCDLYNIECHLVTTDSFGIPDHVLRNFYSRHGFRPYKNLKYRMFYQSPLKKP